MNRFMLLIGALVAFSVGWVCSWYSMDPDVVEIKTTEIRYNTINRDIQTMPITVLHQELSCFYTSTPSLDIEHREGHKYKLSASLCGRHWNRKATIRARDSHRHMVIAGPFIDTRIRIGGWAQYYRLYGSLGIGGGFAYSPGYAQMQGGMLFFW